MQIVYISNRPEILLETLGHVALFMPFVDQAVVCVPDSLVEQLTNQPVALPLKVIPESDVLADTQLKGLDLLDHQSRNYLLRSRLVEHSDIKAHFIMSDDDARPIKKVESTRYIEDGRYHRYYFYDLREWNNNQTEFDAGQLSTCAVLEYNNLPQLSYASHMPQIIDRAYFLEATEFFRKYSDEHPLCEWSSYFNYAAAKHSNMFHEPRAYLTLCWPEHPLAWKQFVRVVEYAFENFTPNCYSAKDIFGGIDTGTGNLERSNHANVEKIIRWQKYSIACLHPEQGSSPRKYLNWRTWTNKLFKFLRI